MDVELPEEQSIERAAGARRDLEALGGLTAHVQRGAPACELVHFSEEVDLLVIGSRDYGPAARLLIGSTASTVARQAHCPVLISRRPSRPPAAEASAPLLRTVHHDPRAVC